MLAMSPFQGTLKNKVKFTGIGLHTGVMVNVEILPAHANTGIIFQRIDIPDALPLRAHPFNVTSTDLCTAIGTGSSRISTIEHLMAAFAGMGIDNAIVKVDSYEIPILDGSAAPFVDRFKIAEVQSLPFFRKIFKVVKPVEIIYRDQFIKIEPSNKLEFNCVIDFNNSLAIGKQSLEIDLNNRNFSDLCDARTFCHIDDVNAMREVGLAKGGSFDNAVVVDSERVLNAGGLRYSDEFVRHKMLDCIGDLFLMGGSVMGRITTYKAGHALHTQLAAKLLKEQSESLVVIDQGQVNFTEFEKLSLEKNLVMPITAVVNQ